MGKAASKIPTMTVYQTCWNRMVMGMMMKMKKKPWVLTWTTR